MEQGSTNIKDKYAGRIPLSSETEDEEEIKLDLK
jgi:hypothetical protein